MSDDPLVGFESDSLVFEQLLGKGAMGAVYKGTQVRLNRPVAIKVIAKHLADDEGYVERFNREAQTMGRLSHPGVIACHDFGSVEGPEGELLVMILEFVDGWSLGDLAKEKKLTVRQVVELHRQAAEGLAAANQLGIVHRDIKPDNLMVTRQGQVKLADFGLAKADDSVLVTQTGAIVGSPAFMSPEAARGEDPAHSGDCYSLACSLFALLCGQPPYMSSSALNVLHQHASSPIPGLGEKGRPDLAPLFDPFFTRALAKDPAKRFANAQAMAQALRQLGNQVPPKLFAGAGVSGTGALPVAEAATVTNADLATIATRSGVTPRARSGHRRSGPQARGRVRSGEHPRHRSRRTQQLVALSAVALLLVILAIAVITSGGGSQPAPRDPAPVTASTTPRTANPAPAPRREPAAQPMVTSVEPRQVEPAPAASPTPQAVQRRISETRSAIQDRFAEVSAFLAGDQLGRAETALSLIDIPLDLAFQDLRDQRVMLQDLIVQRQREAVVAAGQHLDAIEQAIAAGDHAGARAMLDALELPAHPRFDRLAAPLVDAQEAAPADPGENGPHLELDILLQPGQVEAQVVYPIEPGVPSALPYELELELVWRSVADLSGREQVMVLQLPAPLPPERGGLRVVVHGGIDQRELRVVELPSGRELGTAPLPAGDWHALEFDLSAHQDGAGVLLLACSGQRPFHLAQAGIGPSAIADQELITLRGGTLLPVATVGPNSIEPLVHRLYQSSRGAWRPDRPTVILPASRDRARTEAMTAAVEDAIARSYAKALRDDPLATTVRARVVPCRSSAEAGREVDTALETGVGLLVVGFETGGSPPSAIRNWVGFVNNSLERGVLPVAVFIPKDDGIEPGRSWSRAIDDIRREDPAIPLIDLGRALAFADQLDLPWREDEALRQRLLMTGIEAGLHELLWRLSAFADQPRPAIGLPVPE